MSGAFLAASILFLVYVSQCLGSAPPATVLFLLHDRLKGRLLGRCWETAPGGRRVFLLNPFLPHGGSCLCDTRIVLVCERAGNHAAAWRNSYRSIFAAMPVLPFCVDSVRTTWPWQRMLTSPERVTCSGRVMMKDRKSVV